MLVSCALSRVQVVLNREHRREKPMPFCLQWPGNAFSLQSPDGLNQGCCRVPDSAGLLVCFLGHLGYQAEEKGKMLMWLSYWHPKPTLGIWGLQPLQCWVQSVWWEDGHLIVCFYGIGCFTINSYPNGLLFPQCRTNHTVMEFLAGWLVGLIEKGSESSNSLVLFYLSGTSIWNPFSLPFSFSLYHSIAK